MGIHYQPPGMPTPRPRNKCIAELEAEVERMSRLVGDLRAETSDPIADDGRLGYVTVQMTRSTYDELMASGEDGE